MDMPEGWKEMERLNNEHKRLTSYIKDPETNDVLYYNRILERTDIALQLMKGMAEALEKGADSDYWQDNRYPGESGFQAQRDYFNSVLKKFKEWK